jgi:SAM-dependent methyltransferase
VTKAEFDSYADTYYEDHKNNVKITGENPEYFAEYKIADLARYLANTHAPSRRITDFGSGIGNSIPYFRSYFPGAALSCADVSARSAQLAQNRFPGNETYLLIEGEKIPIGDSSQDLVFSACVFHHIPHEDHVLWLKELLRITRPGGSLALYEHNFLNPLTVRAFNTCPLDQNAVLIGARSLRRACLAAGWSNVRIAYRLFFPRSLAYLRPMEQRLGWLCLGAQYRLIASR